MFLGLMLGGILVWDRSEKGSSRDCCVICMGFSEALGEVFLGGMFLMTVK